MAQSRYPATRRSTGMQPAFENWSDWMNRFMPFPSFFERQLSTGMIAPVDVCERDGEFIIRMACPGCRPEDLDVTVQEDTVKIRGQFMEHEMAGMGTGEQAMRAQTGGQTGGQQTTGQQTTGQGTTGQQMTRQQGTEEGTGERCLVRELPTGRFERDITLPTGVDAQRASANYEYGLLTLNVPKSKAAMGQRIQIGRGSQQGTSQNIGVTGR